MAADEVLAYMREAGLIEEYIQTAGTGEER
jgi:hypothetical protein